MRPTWNRTRSTMADRIEIRDGREFHVTVLPEKKPPKNRSMRTHVKLAPGNVGEGLPKPKKKRRRRRRHSTRERPGQ